MSGDLAAKIVLTGMERPVCVERNQDVGRLDAILAGNLAYNGVLEEGRVVRSQRRVGGDGNPFLEAIVDNIFLRTRTGRGLNKVDR